MKVFFSIFAAILLASSWWFASDPTGFRHTVFGYSNQERKAASEDVHRASAEFNRDLDKRLLDAQTRSVELRYGEAAASTYRLCHTNPPITNRHQLECKRLDEQKKRDDVAEPENPW
jgi:hypothetical protein